MLVLLPVPVPGAAVLGPPPAPRRLPPPRLLLREPPSLLFLIPSLLALRLQPRCSVCLSRQLEFWISVLLTILGYLPGVLYAVYVICSVDPHRHRHCDPDDDDDYVYVA